MIRKVKRTLVMVLIVMMSISIIGCGQQDGNQTNTSKVETTQAAGDASTKDTQPDKKEPVTLTVIAQPTGKTFSPGVQDDPVAKRIQELLGISIDVKDSNITDDKYNVLVASGDLPDIFQAKPANMKALVDNNMVLELSSLVETNGPDIKENAKVAVAFSKKYLSQNTDKLFFLPATIDPDGKPFQLVAPYIRWDYYAELGYPQIKNNDDLLNVVAEMLKRHPVNENGEKFYGFSPWFDWGPQWPNLLVGFQNNVWEVAPGIQWDPVNRKLSSWLNDDNSYMWQGSSFYNKAYRMGLLDPDALTQKYDQALQKGNQNRILCEICEWHRGSTNQDLENAGFKGRGMQPLPPYEGTVNYNGTTLNIAGVKDRSWSISSNCKFPDRAMDLLNYFFSIDGSLTINSGVEGDSWVLENGKYKLTDKFLEAMRTDPNYALNTGAFKYNTWAGLGENYKLPTGQAMKLIFDAAIEKENYLQVDKDWCEYWGVESKGDVIPKFAKVWQNSEIASSLTTPTPPDDINRTVQKIKTLIDNTLPKLILAKSDEDFAAAKKKLQEDVNKLGYDSVLQWYTEDYNKAIASEKEFLDSIK